MNKVKVRNVTIGDGNVTIQSMTNIPVTDVCQTLDQINALAVAGCDIVRIAVPNQAAAKAFAEVRKQTEMPLVADIHFDYRLAVAAIEAGADKIRINPGNMQTSQLDVVLDCAKAHNVPIRIGVNGGSLSKAAIERAQNGQLDGLTAQITDKKLDNSAKLRVAALADSVAEYVRYFETRNFCDIVLSVKSSDVRQMIAANKLVARLGYPMHLGVTEAGLARQGIVKNSVGIGALLLDGVGDTIRVSLTADPVEEVYAARDLLVSLGLREGVTFVSCPKCGRCSVDLEAAANRVYEYVAPKKCNVKIAVMGCEVNGPGECSDADLGMAGANGQFVFFRKGQVYKRVDASIAVEEFEKEIDNLLKNT